LLLIQCVAAQWSTLNSGYAVTTNYHGKEVPPGALVTATAGTTNTNVKNVTFKWKYPNGTVAFIDENITVWSNGTKWTNSSGSYLIYYAQSQHTLDVFGDWGVQAFFVGNGGRTKANIECTIKIRATSFNVIPNIPILGTAGATMIMIISFGLFLKKKKKQA